MLFKGCNHESARNLSQLPAGITLQHLDFRPKVKEIIDCIKGNSDAQIVLGGPGFNYYGPDWLEYVELDYGIRGEADLSFPIYLKRLENGGELQSIPGSVYRSDGHIHKAPRELVSDLDETALPAYQLFDLENYYQQGITPGIVTKRGCTQKQIEQALTSLSRADIPFSVSLLFGTPGETLQTIQETLAVIDAYQIPNGVWVTIGICLWTPRQQVIQTARVDGQLEEGESLFEAVNYVSPSLSKDELEELLDLLQGKDGYDVQVNQLVANQELKL